MTVGHPTEALDASGAGGRTVPPFPLFDAPGPPESASDASLVHPEVTYARAIGFRPLKMDMWLPRKASGPTRWCFGCTAALSSWGTAGNGRQRSLRTPCSGCSTRPGLVQVLTGMVVNFPSARSGATAV